MGRRPFWIAFPALKKERSGFRPRLVLCPAVAGPSGDTVGMMLSGVP